jgi:lysophospholipase L1-like esterase
MNLLANGDFENGDAIPDHWECGKHPAFVYEHAGADAGRRCVMVAESKGEVTLRQRGLLLIPGERYRLSACIKTGELADPTRARIILVSRSTPWRVTLEPAQTTSGWAVYETLFTPAPSPDPHYTLVVDIQKGAGKVWVGPIALTPLSPHAHSETDAAALSIEVTPLYTPVSEDGRADLTIRIRHEGTPPTGGSLRAAVHGPDARPVIDLAVTGGFSHYRFEGACATGLYTFSAFDTATGRFATAYLDRLARQTYAAFEHLADATSFKAPTHLLFLGDSLTDFHRGFNYVDKLAFWLQRRHGPRITLKNAGVGGDFVTRVWDRLTGVTHAGAPAHRAGMYNRLYDPRPSHVFLFLGHNDSKLTCASGHTIGFVPLPLFESCYRQIVQKIRDDTQARIILISTMSSFYDTTKANAEKAMARGEAPNLFGKPEALERYNEVIRSLAEAEGCGFIDVYTPSLRHPDKRSLFAPGDGVHISNKGNELVAMEILSYLARTTGETARAGIVTDSVPRMEVAAPFVPHAKA